MGDYKAIYKCRLCGEVFHNGITTDRNIAFRSITEITMGIVCTLPAAPFMTQPHICGGDKEGSIGLADFYGWEMEKEHG